MAGVGADGKCPLSETVEQRLAAFDVGWGAGGDNEELARLGGVRIPEDWRRHIALPVTRMLRREVRCNGCADCAHGKMYCSGLQS